jgi:hypothetical protein
MLESKAEGNFPLMGVKDALAVFITELRFDTNLPASMFLKMVCGESVKIAIKNEYPVDRMWGAPIGMCMNLPSPLFKDSKGEWHRRLLIFLFGQRVQRAEQNLEQQLELELDRIIIKLNRIYLAWSTFVSTRPPYDDLHPKEAAYQPHAYFHRTRTMYFTQISMHTAFIEALLQRGTLVKEVGAKAEWAKILNEWSNYKMAETGKHCNITSKDKEDLIQILTSNHGCTTENGANREISHIVNVKYNLPPAVVPGE